MAPPTMPTIFQSTMMLFKVLILSDISYGRVCEANRAAIIRDSRISYDLSQEHSFYPNHETELNLREGGMHRIAQHANAGDPHLDDIAIHERTDASGRTGGNQVAGLQRHHAGNPTHEKCRRIDHERSVARLPGFTVYQRFNEEIVRPQFGFDVRTHRTESIEALGACELH